MSKEVFKNYIYPIATLSGSIIGVGFLSLPYITMKVGIPVMMVYFVGLTALMVYINVILGKISLSTPDLKRFPGFVGFYLGKNAKKITSFLVVVSSIGVLLIYLIVGGQFLNAILSPILGGNVLIYTISYLLLASLIIYFGIKIVSKIELLTLILLLTALVIIFIKGFPQIRVENIFSISNPISDWKMLFLPYGAVIFSLGTGYIPETEEMLKGSKSLLKNIIIISTLIPAVIYLLFIFLILGISGSQTTESALTGVSSFLGGGVAIVALLIGVITTFIAFVTNGLLLKETFVYDLGFKENVSYFIVCISPLVLFLFGFNSFISLISFIGSVFSGMGIILILMMYKKIGGRKIIIYPLSLIFLLGIIYEIIIFVN